MKVLHFVLGGILLLLSGALLATDSPEVYMVAKNKITGTTFTQVVFFKVMKLPQWSSVKRK